MSGSTRIPVEGPDMAPEPELSQEELDEAAMVEAAIRAGEQAAEEELAAEANAEAEALVAQVAELQDALDAARAEAAGAQERALRIQADWENYRRRTASERLAERSLATEKLVGNLLPVVDDLERAVAHAQANAEGNEVAAQLVSGVDAVRAKLVDVLGREGVQVIDPAGEPFEPLEHQAVGRVEDTEAFDETVRDVYMRGYRMGGKVLRPAMVTITFGGPKRPVEEASDQGVPGGPEEAEE